MSAFLRVCRWIALAVAACAAQAAAAQAVVSGESERLDLWPHARVFSDPSRAAGLDEVLAARDQFVAPGGAYATLGIRSDVVWLRVPLEVLAGGEGTWVLDIDYALLNRIDVHLLRDGKAIQRVALGNSQPFATRPLRSRTHATPLELAAGASSELLLRVETAGARILPMTLSRLPAFHERALDEQILQGVLASLGLTLLLYSLVKWWSLREGLYLKYALLVLCSVAFSVHFFGIGEMYLWTDLVWVERHMAGISALLAAGATALFVQDALAEDLHPRLGVALRAVAALHAIAAIAHGLDWIDIRAVGLLMGTTGLAPALMGIPGAYAKARRGDSVGVWFMLAWLGYFVASAIMVAVVRGMVGANFWTLHSFQLGATLDMLIFMHIAVLRTAARHHAAQRAVQERDTLHSLAHSDPLTGLLNRRGLDEALRGAIERMAPERILAVYVLDLDGFKPVNDQFGHDVGDQLLLVAAQRLRGSVRSGDGVARIGGDEFVVMAAGLSSALQAEELGMKLIDAFRSPFALHERTCTVSATVGYALSPPLERDPAALIKAADAAMYAGKEKGKDRLQPVPA
jgi:diguanylate cyclase (GGDEF)-like protein